MQQRDVDIVREEVRNALATVAKDGSSGVKAELEKGVLRHVSVQPESRNALVALLPARMAGMT